jgi:hypothetical protein
MIMSAAVEPFARSTTTRAPLATRSSEPNGTPRSEATLFRTRASLPGMGSGAICFRIALLIPAPL